MLHRPIETINSATTFMTSVLSPLFCAIIYGFAEAEVISSFLDRKSCICTARELIHIEATAFRSLPMWGYLWSLIPYSINGIIPALHIHA